MSGTAQFLVGIALVMISIGSLMVCYPRGGRTAWFVGIPFLEPGVSILIVAGLFMGLILIAGYFTAIDEATLVRAGKL